jgi:DNA-binding SARP family transcriptional activator
MALAKTTRPSARGVIPRPRLFRLLDATRSRPVTWVWGPPGAGKTSLVASYLRARRLAGLWYQIDSGDADPATFFHYLRGAAPGGSKTLPPLTPEYLPGLATFTRRFFQELFRQFKPPFALVLDNYHEVEAAPSFPEVISGAITELPPGGRVVILSRTEPPPAFASLQTSRGFRLLTGADLRLTTREAAQLIRAAGIRRLTREASQAIQETADGWAAGLVLLLEELRSGKGDGQTTRSASTVAFDYFAAEIFKRTPPGAQQILLQTSLLPRLTARLAERLTELPEAGHILSELSRQNYFTTAHGTGEPAYQFHPLFREFLRSEAQRAFPLARRADLLRKGAALLEEAGQIEDAVGLLTEARDWARLAELIRQSAPALLAEGRGQTLIEWIGRVPETIRSQDPWLLYWHGAAVLPLEPGKSRPDFERAFALFRGAHEPVGVFLTWSAVAETLIHESCDLHPLDRWIPLLADLLEEFPDFPSPDIEARVVSCLLPAMYWRQPQHRDLETWIERAESIFHSHPSIEIRLRIGLHLVGHAFWTGAFGRASTIADSLAGLADNDTVSPLLRLIAKTAIGLCQWLAASLDASLRTTADALYLAQTSGVHVWDYHLLSNAGAAELSRGNEDAAGNFLQRIAEGLPRARPFDVLYYHYLIAWRAILQRDLSQAASAQRRSLQASIAIGIPLIEAQLRLQGVWIDLLRDPCPAEEVGGQLKNLHGMAHETRSQLVRFSTLLAEAYLQLRSGREREAFRPLGEAMRLGRENGYRNTYTWLNPVMARLCAKALVAGIEREYVLTLIRERGLFPDPPPVEVEAWPWPVKVFTLGRFELVRDGEPVQFSGKAQKRPLGLLKALIALGGEDVSEERLADLLWPDAEGDAAQQALATTVHRLRRLLGRDETLRRQAGRLSLDRRHCWVDAWAVEALLARAEDAISGFQPGEDAWEQSANRTERAANLYRGDFLRADPDAPWARPMTERLRSRLVRQLQRIAANHQDRGKVQEAVAANQRALEIAATSE